MRFIRPKIGLILVGVWLLASWTPTSPRACACSGGPTYVNWLLENSSHVIKARLIESDAAGQNHIVQVEEYLIGEPGPEFILLSQNRLATIQGLYDKRLGVSGDCNFFYETPPADRPFYMFVRHTVDGAYVQIGGISSPEWYSFPAADSTVGLFVEPTTEDSDDLGELILTEPEFRAFLADFTGETPSSPLPDQPYARKNPALITSAAGTRYLLPADSNAPTLISDETLAMPLTRWPNRYTLYANFEPCWGERSERCTLEAVDGRFARQVIDGQPDYILSPYGIPLGPGEDMLAASTGTTALWNGNKLVVYAPHNMLWSYSEIMPSIPTNSTELDTSGDLYGAAYATWSPDGRYLAYADGAGLWWWDVLGDSAEARPAPERVPLPEEISAAWPRFFSPDSRSLAITDGMLNFTLDLRTSAVFEDGAISPTGTWMLVLGQDQQPITAPRRLALRGLAVEGEQELVRYARDVAWIDDHRFVAVVCQDAEGNDCGIWRADVMTLRHPYYYGNVEKDELEPGTAFFLADTGALAALVDDTTITIEGVPLTLELDAPIQGFRWLPSLFWE